MTGDGDVMLPVIYICCGVRAMSSTLPQNAAARGGSKSFLKRVTSLDIVTSPDTLLYGYELSGLCEVVGKMA